MSWAELPGLVRARYAGVGTRWTDLLESGAGVRSLGPDEQVGWRRPGVVDVLTAVFADRFGCWAWLDLWRTTRDAFTAEECRPVLTRRECEVLAELATGADSRRIAERLVLSDHTVNDHVKAILAETGAHTRPALLARAAGTG